MRVTVTKAEVRDRASSNQRNKFTKVMFKGHEVNPGLERLKLEVQPGPAVQQLQRHKAAAKVRLAVAKLTGG